MPLNKAPNLISPNVNGSSDESLLEIGWDDNSSSPTTILQEGKGRKCTQKDISTLLNEISKQKYKLEKTKDSNTEQSLSTWMQSDLVVTRKNRNKKNTSRLRETSKKGWQKKGALSFNEELKRFMEVVLPKDNIATCQLIAEKTTASKDSNSPDFFQSSKNDSLLMNDLLDLDLDDVDISLPQKNKENSFFLVKTPKLCRKMSKDVTPDEQNIYMPKTSSAKRKNVVKRKQLDLATEIDDKKDIASLTSQLSRPKPILDSDRPLLSPITKSERVKPRISFELNDGLDEILSSQDVFSNGNNGNKDLVNQLPDKSSLVSHKDFNKKSKKTKNEDNNMIEVSPNNPTPPPLKTPKGKQKYDNVIVFEDDDAEFDDFALNLDDEITCKSQETPPSIISVEQRKLKKRCHTSPFPVSRKQILQKKAKHFAPDVKIEDKEGSLFCTREPKIIDRLIKQDNQVNLNISSRTFATEATRQPFKPPFNDESFANKSKLNKTNKKDKKFDMNCKKDENDNVKSKHLLDSVNLFQECPMDISAIKATPKEFHESEKELYDDWKGKPAAPFSSTQRCSLTEIERKRKEAKSRLQHRLKRR